MDVHGLRKQPANCFRVALCWAPKPGVLKAPQRAYLFSKVGETNRFNIKGGYRLVKGDWKVLVSHRNVMSVGCNEWEEKERGY